jgi:probable HAF family extracellular repeat protein
MRAASTVFAVTSGLLLAACDSEQAPMTAARVSPQAAIQASLAAKTDVVSIDLGTLSAYPHADYGAVAINDRGQVVGVLTTSGGEIRSFLWWHGAMTDLGLPGDQSEVKGINNAGQVIGTYHPSSAPCGPGCHGFRAFVWDRGVKTDLGTLGGVDILASAINEAGQIVGIWVKADRSSHGFIWERGVMRDLGDLGGDWTVPGAINNAGRVAGTSKTADGKNHAFLWTNGVITDLGERPSDAAGINNRGQVIGGGWTSTGEFHGFLWTRGVTTDLGTLGGTGSAVGAINDRGQVVGTSRTADDRAHAFLWFRGSMTDLSNFSDDMSGLLINNAGDVAGEMWAQQQDHAFIWSHGMLTDLTPDSLVSSTPRAMNNSGQVVGDKHMPGGVHAFLWQLGPSNKAGY